MSKDSPSVYFIVNIVNNVLQFKELNQDGIYTVTFDSIDGGTIIDANYSVASIFAIWKQQDIIGCTGKDVVGAALAIYGSRTSMVIYNTQT